MILLVPLFGQRDSRWASDLLGFNTKAEFNLGNYGCLITCFASYINKTPREVNELLKANNGFQNGGLFVWSKCTALGLNQTYVSTRYDGPASSQALTKIKDSVMAGFPVVCEVDFNPNTVGEEMHYVLICGVEGDKVLAMDPWVGQIVDMDLYGGPQRAIIQFRTYDKAISPVLPTSNPASFTWLPSLLSENGIDLSHAESRIREIFDQAKKYEVAQKERDKALRDLAEARGDATKWEELNLTSSKEIKRLNDEIDDLRRGVKERDSKITSLEARVVALEGQLDPDKVLVITREEYSRLTATKQLDKFTQAELIKEFIFRFFRRTVS